MAVQIAKLKTIPLTNATSIPRYNCPFWRTPSMSHTRKNKYMYAVDSDRLPIYIGVHGDRYVLKQ